MLRENQQIRTLAIVIIGNFNPAIIQPFWLSKKNLIKESDAENARDVLIHDQLTQFNLGWVAIEISLDKMRLLSFVELACQLPVKYWQDNTTNKNGCDHFKDCC